MAESVRTSTILLSENGGVGRVYPDSVSGYMLCVCPHTAGCVSLNSISKKLLINYDYFDGDYYGDDDDVGATSISYPMYPSELGG